MARLRVKGIAFDVYGTLVDVAALAGACQALIPDPVVFTAQWRAKQLEYTFLRTLTCRYRDFWSVTEEALEFTIRRFALEITPVGRQRLMHAWLCPTPYPEVPSALAQLQDKYRLAVLSNGTPRMIQTCLERSGCRPVFRWLISANAVKVYKPSLPVYQLALKRMRLQKKEILLVSSNAFDVLGAKSFGLKVCWVNRTGAPLDPLGLKPDLVVKNFDELVCSL